MISLNIGNAIYENVNEPFQQFPWFRAYRPIDNLSAERDNGETEPSQNRRQNVCGWVCVRGRAWFCEWNIDSQPNVIHWTMFVGLLNIEWAGSVWLDMISLVSWLKFCQYLRPPTKILMTQWNNFRIFPKHIIIVAHIYTLQVVYLIILSISSVTHLWTIYFG